MGWASEDLLNLKSHTATRMPTLRIGGRTRWLGVRVLQGDDEERFTVWIPAAWLGEGQRRGVRDSAYRSALLSRQRRYQGPFRGARGCSAPSPASRRRLAEGVGAPGPSLCKSPRPSSWRSSSSGLVRQLDLCLLVSGEHSDFAASRALGSCRRDRRRVLYSSAVFISVCRPFDFLVRGGSCLVWPPGQARKQNTAALRESNHADWHFPSCIGPLPWSLFPHSSSRRLSLH